MNDAAQKSLNFARSAELRPGSGGRLTLDWSLTDTKLSGPVQLAVPPVGIIPIIFVPGIMGSNLCDTNGQPLWLLNSTGGAPVGLAVDWVRRNAGTRQKFLHPDRTRVYGGGNVPAGSTTGLKPEDFKRRGWGEISESSYHKFLLWLDQKMNGTRDPTKWDDFDHSALAGNASAAKVSGSLPRGLIMHMAGLPDTADDRKKVTPVTSDDLLMRSKFSYPIYAYGYNWLDSNVIAAEDLKSKIESLIAENNGPFSRCIQVIVITHSMGG